jgi:hypothetical protein
MFYAIYGGWHLNRSNPIIFNEPSQALAWSVSRMIRDGIIWNPTSPPKFLPFVGQVEVECQDLVSTSFSSLIKGKPSKIEQNYFNKVVFHKLKKSSSVQSKPTYLKCKKSTVNSVLSTMNSKADYLLSAGSIYRKTEICPPSSSSDVEFEYLSFLDNFKRRDSSFIQLQHNCSHLKENAKFDKGTLYVFTFLVLV